MTGSGLGRWWGAIAAIAAVAAAGGMDVGARIVFNLEISRAVRPVAPDNRSATAWMDWIEARGYTDPCGNEYSHLLAGPATGAPHHEELAFRLFESCARERATDEVVAYYLGDMALSLGHRSTAQSAWEGLHGGVLVVLRAYEFIAEREYDNADIALSAARFTRRASYSTAYALAVADTYYLDHLLRMGEDTSDVCASGDADYQVAVLLRPDYGFLRVEHGKLLRSCGLVASAIERFEEVGDGFASETQAWASLEAGLTMDQAGDAKSAIRWFERAVQLDSAREEYGLVLGYALLKAGDYSRAREVFDELASSADMSVSERAANGLKMVDEREARAE